MKNDFKVFVSVDYFNSIINVRISELPSTEKALNDIANIVDHYVNEEIRSYLTMKDIGLIK